MPQENPITVSEAISRLGQLAIRGRGDLKLMVPFNPGFATLGPSPATPIVNFSSGFDWDNGRLFLNTVQPLGPAGEELIQLREQLHRAHEALALVQTLAKDKRLNAEEKLGDVKRILAKYRAGE